MAVPYAPLDVAKRPRHVPDDIFAVAEIPYTLSGKKMEVPVRKILLGQSVEQAATLGAMRNPESINYFVEFARSRSRQSPAEKPTP